MMSLFIGTSFLSMGLILANFATADTLSMTLAGKEVCLPTGSQCYYVGKNDVMKRIFARKQDEQTGKPVPWSRRVESILAFKGNLYALQKDGDLFQLDWESRKGERYGNPWIRVARNIEKLKTDGQRLYAIDKRGALGLYDGSDFSFHIVNFGGLATANNEKIFWVPPGLHAGVEDVIHDEEGLKVVFKDDVGLPHSMAQFIGGGEDEVVVTSAKVE